jgi:hypothetical protein
VPSYRRVATVGVQAAFIDGLADLVLSALADPAAGICNDGALPACGEGFPTCPRRTPSTSVQRWTFADARRGVADGVG